jgi:protein tyrosine phosphatase type 4A
MSGMPEAPRNSTGMMTIGSRPTLITHPPMKFLIMDAPRQANLHLYIKEMRKHSVTHVVRVCEPTYHGGELVNAGIQLSEMAYEDGHSPPKEIIDRWLGLVDSVFYQTTTSITPNNNNNSESCIAVHCVAGLGRAPVLVALALIEFANMDPVEAVSFIRKQRRGAINEKQLIYLEGYKRQYRNNTAQGGCCVIC